MSSSKEAWAWIDRESNYKRNTSVSIQREWRMFAQKQISIFDPKIVIIYYKQFNYISVMLFHFMEINKSS